MRYALYILYRYYNESKYDKIIAFEKSKIVFALVLGFNFSTASLLTLPEWILDRYFGYLLSLSICLFYIIFSVFLRKTSIVISQFEKRYKRNHFWAFILFVIFSFTAFAVVAMSNFNPNYKRKHQPFTKEVFTEGKGDITH